MVEAWFMGKKFGKVENAKQLDGPVKKTIECGSDIDGGDVPLMRRPKDERWGFTIRPKSTDPYFQSQENDNAPGSSACTIFKLINWRQLPPVQRSTLF